MLHPSNHRVAIIGGGLSGLAAAAKLRTADPDLRISLFETRDRLGGVIHTESEDGFLIDLGADMFATNPPAALDLCRQLGIADRLIEPESDRRGARIVYRGRLVPIPDGFVLMRATRLIPMLTTPLLSLAGKLRFLAERWVPLRDPSKGDESVAEFVRRRMGSEVLDRIVAPLAAGIYTADISKLSMQATMGPILDMERRHGSLARASWLRRRRGDDSVERTSTGARYGQFRSFEGGMIELINALAAKLPKESIHLSCPVESIDHRGSTWTLHTAAGESEEFDHVILATPAATTADLLCELVPEASRELASIESASTAIVVLGVRRADVREDIETFGFVVPQSEGRRILAGSFASHKFAGRAPNDHVLIRVFIGGALQNELLELSDDALVDLARQELSELISLDGTPVISRVVRWNHAMPQYHVGHCDRVARIEHAVEQQPGLWLISNALYGVGISPVIAAADRVAAAVVASFTASADAAGDRTALDRGLAE